MSGLAALARRRPAILSILYRPSYSTAAASAGPFPLVPKKSSGRWRALPPFAPQMDLSSIGKRIAHGEPAADAAPVTVLKWVRRCCPELPVALVHKFFRLRQVRKEQTSQSAGAETQAIKRVSAKDAMSAGDVIRIPVSVQIPATEKKSNCFISEADNSFVRGLELYMDPAIIAINKPPGMAVQGGVGIKYSVDVLAASLKYDLPESPRLVHRLDRDSSGVLILGRTQNSATILHSIFREKTSDALSDNTRKALQRRYWALVIGTPRNSKGLISAPLVKIVVDDGKSERVTIARNMMDSSSAQPSLTEYKVVKSSPQGYTWLELSPLTGRKHQLRVHCAEALGTPIVGDYKYGWQAHRNWEPTPGSPPTEECETLNKEKLPFPFDLEFDGGSISDKQPRLHLHCRQMVMPNISAALQQLESSSSTPDLSKIGKISLLAPLPLHMQTSWGILDY